jgi:sarcosine oxidase
MMQDVDVIVIGGGVMGCAAAYHLARDGQRTLLLEQFQIGHAFGSSHGHSRIIRLVYDHPAYVALMPAAFRLWRELEAASGTQLLWTTGGLDLGPAGSHDLAAISAALDSQNVAFDLLDQADLARRYPQFQLPAGSVAIYQAESGILDADGCVAALAAGARSSGASLHEDEPVLGIEALAEGVEVTTGRARYRAGRAIVCAGSWAGPLLRQVGLELPLSVRKEQIAFLAAREAAPFQPGAFPIFIDHGVYGHVAYGFPFFGLPGLKVAFHVAGPLVDPAADTSAIDVGALDALRGYATRLLPGLTSDVLYATTCRYTMAPDGHFLVDAHPSHPQILVASPCSGHGFKFGILIGRILADLSQRGVTDHPIELFKLARLKSI